MVLNNKLWSALRRLITALIPRKSGLDDEDEPPRGCITYKVPRAPDETPSGLICDDPKRLQLAYAAMEALDDDRLDEGRQLVDQLIATYPDCLWGYELYDRYLQWSRDVYAPENRIDVDDFLKESIRNLEHMLVLNPKDECDVYFAWGEHDGQTLHWRLAQLHCDAAWEASSQHAAQAALEECRRHLAAWTAEDGSTFPAQSQRVLQAEYIEALCASAADAWTKTAGRTPTDAEKMPALDEGDMGYLNGELRWPWKAGLVPNITYHRVACEDTARLRLTHAVLEALVNGRRSRGKRLLDVLIATYPDCIWGCELYDLYLGRDDSYATQKERVRNYERMLVLNPDDDGGGPEGYFEADICIRQNLKKSACKAAWDAPTEHEARAMQAICVREIEDRRQRWREIGLDADDSSTEAVESEDTLLMLDCAAVMTAWAEAGAGVPSDDDKRAVRDRMEAASVRPYRVLEVLEYDMVAVEIDGKRKEILAFVDDLAVGDFVGVDLCRHGVSKIDPDEAMAMLAAQGQDHAPTYTIRTMQPADWPSYKALRLRALRDAPDAFGSTLAAESPRPDSAWQDRLVAASASGHDLPLFALAADLPVGLLWAKTDAVDAEVVNLFQMWVAPEHRGAGCGRLLLNEAIAWARARGAASVRLGVTIADSAAFRLYTTHGFTPVGAPEPLREGSSLLAQTMQLRLDPGRV